MIAGYPQSVRERDRWILDRRPPREPVDPSRPYAFLIEEEHAASGDIEPVATIFLTNRECPYRCLMCDLWRHTLTETVPPGAIPAQLDYALERLPAARQVKLYNSGSFFDPRAIPPADYAAIAERVAGFERVIVECHPALVGPSCARFAGMIGGQLEVAMGLETVHPEVLPRLNKRMTVDRFARAATFLRESGIALRVFILVQPPFMDAGEALHWAERSLEFAFDCGATVASLIPTRAGNGVLEVLQQSGDFTPPQLATLEAALAYGLAQKRGRVFADLWDLERFADCAHCFAARAHRLNEMNRRQTLLPAVECEYCTAAPAGAMPC
jgi:hypothetical protein